MVDLKDRKVLVICLVSPGYFCTHQTTSLSWW